MSTRNTPKSVRTRQTILTAAMRVFAEMGWERGGLTQIAAAAEMTRGALLYHFPTREDLAAAVALHVQAERAAHLERIAGRLEPGEDPVDAAIEGYFRLLSTEPFRAFSELEHAARTDDALAAAIRPAQEAFDRADMQSSPGFLQAGVDARFQASRDLARFALEGLARAGLTYKTEERTTNLLRVIKRATHMLNRKSGVGGLWED